MKKIIYTIALYLAATAAGYAQQPVAVTKDELAEVVLLNDDLLVFTKKEQDGQYIYTAKPGIGQPAQRAIILNTGFINAIVGSNSANQEVFVYHKAGRNDEKIAVYKWQNGGFEKVSERPVPRMRNHSYNLGMFLTENLQDLYISAELGKTQGYDDVYLSKWTGKKWSKPKALGKQVNTRQPEFAPFVTSDSLFFSRAEKGATYVYGTPLAGIASKDAQVTRLSAPINKEGVYNAYYKKSGEQQFWVSAAGAGTDQEANYTAYVLALVAAVEEVVEPVVEAPVPASPVLTAAPEVVATKVLPALSFTYSLNEVFLRQQDEKAWNKFLSKQRAGTEILIKGYSDAIGTAAGKQRVSQQRAQFLKWYADRYFKAKGFVIKTENAVLPEKGRENRKVDIVL